MEDLSNLIAIKNDKKAYYDRECLVSLKLISHIS